MVDAIGLSSEGLGLQIKGSELKIKISTFKVNHDVYINRTQRRERERGEQWPMEKREEIVTEI